MSTQDDTGLPVSLVPEQERQHFRLLELPAEVLSLLAADSPVVLELKSSDETTGSDDGGSAVLCTPNRTFNVRQKNSSNSTYVLQTLNVSTETLAKPEVRAIAQCHSTIELTPANTGSAITHVKRLLPVYSSTGLIVSGLDVTKRELFNQVPSSERECQDAYRELAAFTHPTSGRCFRPSAQVKVQAWHDLYELAIASNIDLTKSLSEADISSLHDRNTDIDCAVAQATLDAVVTQSSDGRSLLDADPFMKWIGANLLEAKASHEAISATKFLQSWKDLSPEVWRDMTELSKLGSCCRRINGGKDVIFHDDSLKPNGTANGGATGNKRKWHEKFRPSKMVPDT